ncbi:MAG: FliG C-terminal domain-containing protein [Parvularculaceae bacterium]
MAAPPALSAPALHQMGPQITRAHKAAIILAALGPEAARAIVSEISDAHLKAFAKAFGDLKSVPPQLLHAVAREFLVEVDRFGAELAGGLAEASRLLEALAGEERVARLRAGSAGGGAQGVFARLELADARALAVYLAAQRPEVAAVVLDGLSAEKTAAILDAGDASFAQGALIELTKTRNTPGASKEIIAAGVECDFLGPLTAAPPGGGAAAIVTEIVNCLPSAKRDALLAHLDREDAAAAKAVRKALIMFEDLHARLPESAPPILIREIDKETLLKAAKYGRINAPDTVKFLFGAVSKRMVEQYEEEIAAMGELTPAEGENAQRKVMSAVRRLAAAGSLKIKPIAADPA